MKILLAATPVAGHVNPILAAARILLRHGHEVMVTTASAFRAQVEATGAGFAALSAGADMDLADIDRRFPERTTLAPGLPQLAFDFRHIFIDTIPAQCAGLEAILKRFPADVILADAMFGGCLPLLLRPGAQRPAIAGLGMTCLITRRTDLAPAGMGLPPALDDATTARYAAIAADVDTRLMIPARQRVDEILEGLGARTLPQPYLEALISLPDVFLQPSVPSFDFPCMKVPANLHFIGALPVPAAGPLPPTLRAAVDSGKRLVLVTLGGANQDPGQLIAPALRALAGREDTIVLADTGGRPLPDMPPPLPGNVMAAQTLPLEALMPHLDLVVTSGGYDSVTQAVRHGVPLVAAGVGEDRQDVNARIAWTGVGMDLRTDTPSVDLLRAAIDEVLGRRSYKRRAAMLAREYAAYDTEKALCSLLAQAAGRQAMQRRTRHADGQASGASCTG